MSSIKDYGTEVVQNVTKEFLEGAICVARGGKPLWVRMGSERDRIQNMRIRSPEMGEAKSEVS